MPHFDQPAPPAEPDDRPTQARNARVGMVLFVLYLLVYGTYVAINAFRPAVMDARVYAGVNLAVLSGLGLIAAALVLAFVYGWVCRAPAGPRAEGRP